MKTTLFFLLLAAQSFASDLALRPPSFRVPEGLAVFTDFTQAKYEITYDYLKKEALVTSRIVLETAEAGHPVFDLVGEPLELTIDGIPATAPVKSTPDNVTKIRVISKKVDAGRHVVVIKSSISELVSFTAAGVNNGFWMDDLKDRSYLEKYLPSNLMYDRIPMEFNVTVLNALSKQSVYTNGVTERTGDNKFKITFPRSFNASSPFFHLVPTESVFETKFNYKSIDGRELPVLIYFKKELSPSPELRFERLKRKTLAVMNELERDYGAFPHPAMTIYMVADGGMEYAGATLTSEANLAHEIFHSYFARGVMPADGNASWIDEALATWRDDGYKTLPALPTGVQLMKRGPYFRYTDLLAYGFGGKFFAYLSGKVGDLRPFMRVLLEKKTLTPFTLDEFITEMSSFYAQDLSPEFAKLGVIPSKN
ncbi:MAG TPA: hypothetical protein VNJ01_11145 [Bacteriovoracaceae bacterium]|nr:hypothetical protein [Bacteriovoracaceae bacterium]